MANNNKNIFANIFKKDVTTTTSIAEYSVGTTKVQNFDYTPNYNPLLRYNGVFANGEANLFPEYINDLYTHSPLHAAIINFKTQLTVGNGFIFDDSLLDIGQKILLNQLVLQFESMVDQIGFDYFLASKFFVEVTWNTTFTKIVKLEAIPHEKIRVVEVDEKMRPTKFEYCYDWCNYTRFPRKEMFPFSQQDKEHQCQLDYFELRSPGQIIYNRPKYEAAIDWINQDKMMAQYHQANMQNSVNPSALIEFFQAPKGPKEQQEILNDLNNSFAGAKKAGRLMALFSPSPEVATKFTQLEPNKLDKTFITLGDQIGKSICYAHSIDPAILGIRVSGQLGQGVTLEESFKLFNYQQITPAQKDIQNFLNRYTSINGLPIKIKFNSAEGLYPSANTK